MVAGCCCCCFAVDIVHPTIVVVVAAVVAVVVLVGYFVAGEVVLPGPNLRDQCSKEARIGPMILDYYLRMLAVPMVFLLEAGPMTKERQVEVMLFLLTGLLF